MLQIGSLIQEQLDLTEEALEHMRMSWHEREPMFVMTKQGIGLLLGRYHLTAGLGLFLHLHLDPVAAAHIVSRGALQGREGRDYTVSRRVKSLGGALTKREEAVYPILAEAWESILSLERHGLFRVDSHDSMTLGELRERMSLLAAFVGCDLTFTVRKTAGSRSLSPGTRVKCYAPILLEALLLYLLSEVRERSATRGAVCRLEDPRERRRDGIALTLHYPLYPREEPSAKRSAEAFHSHLSVLSELGGIDVYFPAELPPSPLDKGTVEQFVMLDQLLDPRQLSTTDLKARLRLQYREIRGSIPVAAEEEPFL